MTAVLDRPVVAVRARSATAALALAEVRLLLQNLMLWVGVVITVALFATWTWTWQPVWDVFATNAGMSALVLAGFLILLGHLAASRDHRHGAREAASALPATPERRTLALLALVPVSGLVGALVLGFELVVQAPAWPAGVFEPWAALVPVVAPMLGMAIGVAVGRWLPATAAGPLSLFTAAAVLAVLPVLGSTPSSVAWRLFPVELQWTPAPGFPRPTGWHLLFLLAGLVVVAVAALLRHRRWRPGLAVALSLAVVLASVAVRRQGVEQVPEGAALLPATERYLEPAAQRCERHDRVDYCPLPGYGRWVPLWRAAVEPVVAAVPAVAGDLPAVRQGIGPVTDAVTGLRWARHGAWAEDSRSDLSAEYVRVLLGLPHLLPEQQRPPAPPGQQRAEWPVGMAQGAPVSQCLGAGQLRTVVGLYLVAQAQRDSRWWLAGPGRIRLGGLQPGAADRAAAAKLLDAPREQVTAVLAQHWPSVRSSAPAGDTLAAFGVNGLPATGAGSESPCP